MRLSLGKTFWTEQWGVGSEEFLVQRGGADAATDAVRYWVLHDGDTGEINLPDGWVQLTYKSHLQTVVSSVLMSY